MWLFGWLKRSAKMKNGITHGLNTKRNAAEWKRVNDVTNNKIKNECMPMIKSMKKKAIVNC